MRKRGPVQIDGRTWGYTSSIYDLSAAARYEYTKTYSTVGDPLRFSVPPLEQRSAANGWAQECPYCELITYDLTIDDQAKSACPMCRRELLWTHNAD